MLSFAKRRFSRPDEPRVQKLKPKLRTRAPREGSLEAVEREYVERVIKTCATLRAAARRLGIDVSTLWRMRQRWGLG